MKNNTSNPTTQDKIIAWLQLTRFDKPVGTELLLYPTLWALFLAQFELYYQRISEQILPPLDVLILFTLGVVFMRAAGCAINDFADRKVDGLVKRTHTRPLADGRLSPKTAVATFVGLSLMAACLLVFLPRAVFHWSLVAVCLAFIYPFMKRYTHLPQVVLATAFGWAIPMAYVAIQGGVSFIGWALFIAFMCWTVAYDTMYAMCDKDDDVKIGVKSTAILFHQWFGKRDIYVVMALNAIFVLIMMAVVGYFFGVIFAFMLVIGLGRLFLGQYHKIKNHERWQCFLAFKSNVWVGRVVFVWVAGLCMWAYCFDGLVVVK